jgi:hypothetical protein
MVKIKNRKLTRIGNGQCFLVPSAYLEGKMEDGISYDRLYDLEITESDNGESEDEHNSRS